MTTLIYVGAGLSHFFLISSKDIQVQPRIKVMQIGHISWHVVCQGHLLLAVGMKRWGIGSLPGVFLDLDDLCLYRIYLETTGSIQIF